MSQTNLLTEQLAALMVMADLGATPEKVACRLAEGVAAGRDLQEWLHAGDTVWAIAEGLRASGTPVPLLFLFLFCDVAFDLLPVVVCTSHKYRGNSGFHPTWR